MEFDPLVLARIQFAANITFHILFPTITIGMGWLLLFFKLRYDATGEARWMDNYRLWVKVFALSFAMGVVSGITMSFQFGTNWPGFMERVGNIAGPLLSYEILSAFFFEATFLAVMLFGYGRVSNRLHTVSTLIVAAGTTLSAYWIIVLNSWMQTPVGFEMIDGQAHATDWLAILFNPSMPYRLAHMLIASGLTVSFLVAGLSAYRWLRGDRGAAALAGLRTGAVLGALLIPLQIAVGDMHGLNTLEHQPAKIAAMEGVWHTEQGAPLLLFALPDDAARENRYALGIPKLASLVLKHDPEAVIRGLNEFEGKHPRVAPVFWAFRVMVGVGVLMLLASWFTVWRLRRQGTPSTWHARLLVAMTFSGWIATVAGWYVTEMGRQPYLVYGVLTTAEAVAPHPPGMLLSSLLLYLLLYAFLLAAYVGVLFRLARQAGKSIAQPDAPRLAPPAALPLAT